jgi:hypothetical protein
VLNFNENYNAYSALFRHLLNQVFEVMMDSLKVTVTKVQNLSDAQIFIGGLPLNVFQIKINSEIFVSSAQLLSTYKLFVKCGQLTARQGNLTEVLTLSLSVVCQLAVLATFWIYRRSHEPRSIFEYFFMV